MNAFVYDVFFFDFEPFFEEVIVDFSFNGDGFIAFSRQIVFLSR